MKNAAPKTVASFWLPTSAVIVGLAWAAAFSPAPAAAQATSAQQQQACTPDAMRLCGEFIPDVAKITACMARKRSSLSPACRATMVSPSHGRRPSHHHHSHH
ncbi:MAG TPA: hypothetical protein VGI22_04045 [Xanthobacteraceae bacterium]|jgi:hypothetical protein